MTTTTVSPIVILDAYVAPTSIFERLSEIKKWSWLALLLLLAVMIASNYFFFGGMSTSWLGEQQLLLAGDLSGAELKAATEMMEQTAQYTGILGGVFGAIFQLLFLCVFAAYFMLVAKFYGNNDNSFKFGDWFSFSIWTQMPMLISMLGFVALFATASTADLPLGLANYASLNQLLLGLNPSDALFTWAESINLFSLWSIVISMIGLRVCCGLSMVKASVLSLLPYVGCFGLWFVVL